MTDLNATLVALASPIDMVRERPGGRSARIRARVLEAVREEIAAGGYDALSHRAVARRAEVDPATVYRRWPTRPRLAGDALLDIARSAVAVPDTGALASDLEEFLASVTAALTEPRLLRLFHALSAARAEAETDLAETLSAFWQARFAYAEPMIARGVERGEIPPGTDAHDAVEALVAPAYFRALVTGEPLDERLRRRCVERVLGWAGGPAAAG